MHTDKPEIKERDLLATCPQDRRDRYVRRAQLVSSDGRKGKLRTAIRLKCLECCNWQEAETSRCQIVNCALWGLGGQRTEELGED